MTRDLLRLAIPSKGRLLDPTLGFLEDCGFRVRGGRGSRGYAASIPSLPEATVDLTSAGEIPERLAEGAVHLGITGIDLVSELMGATPASIDDPSTAEPGSPLIVRRLGFGRADVVVAVPRAWIDVTTMADLAQVARLYRRKHKRRMRVATKFHSLTRDFFSRHHVSDYRIVDSAGATEAAPSTGLADIIVDITSTGRTLAENHLKTFRDGTILSSEATLFVSAGGGAWSDTAVAGLRKLLDMVDAKINAASRRLIRASVPVRSSDPRGDMQAMLEGIATSGVAAMPVQSGDIDGDAISVIATVDALKTYDAVRLLREAGAGEIIVQDTDYVFDQGGGSFDRVAAALGFA